MSNPTHNEVKKTSTNIDLFSNNITTSTTNTTTTGNNVNLPGKSENLDCLFILAKLTEDRSISNIQRNLIKVNSNILVSC